MTEHLITVIALMPLGDARGVTLLGRDAAGAPRRLRVPAGHLLLSLMRPGERWALFVAGDNETVTGGGYRGE